MSDNHLYTMYSIMVITLLKNWLPSLFYLLGSLDSLLKLVRTIDVSQNKLELHVEESNLSHI